MADDAAPAGFAAAALAGADLAGSALDVADLDVADLAGAGLAAAAFAAGADGDVFSVGFGAETGFATRALDGVSVLGLAALAFLVAAAFAMPVLPDAQSLAPFRSDASWPMTLRLMKALAREFSMTRSLCLGAVVALLASPAAAQAVCAQTAAPASTSGPAAAGLAPDIVAAGQQPHGYPTFCSIPKMPTDVRGVAEWKAAVLDIRRSGATLQRQTAPDTWTLDGSTAGFAAESRSEAAAPPPMNPDQDTDAFARQLKERATPPPRPR